MASGDVTTAPAVRRNGVVEFYHSVRVELAKVTWPAFPDVRRATVAIIIFVLLLGLVIWLLDAALAGVLVKLIPSLFAR